MRFNIGDEVIVTGPTRCGSNAHIGKKFKITERDDIYFSTLDLPWFPWGSLELVEPELKIGDWTEIIGPSVAGYKQQIGEIFQITQMTKDLCWMGAEYSSRDDIFSAKGMYPYPAASLRKLTPEEVAKHLAPPINTPQNQFNEKTDARLSAIEQRLSSIERSQNGQSKYLVMKQWTAGP